MGSSISCTDNGCDAWCTPQHANKVVPQSTPDIPVSDKAAAQPRSAHNSKRDVAPSAGPATSAAEATTVTIFDPPKEEARSPEPASPPHEVRSPVTSVCREDAPFYVIRKTEDVKNDYTIAEELGHGQFGVVSIAIEKSTGKKYAIKTMSKRKAATNPDFCKDVRAEVEIMYHLVGHANIVQLHDVYEDGESIHLIMELCQGGDWFARLLKDGTYSEVQAAATIRTILKALAYCHSLGVVHRDIKPENMIYSNRSEDAKIKLADFGLSAMMPQTVMAAPGWNRNDAKAGLLHETVGTPYYVAPEVLESCGYGQECDIWSMGVVVFICLGGYPPFNGGNQQQVFYAIKYKPLSFENPTWDHISEIAKDLIRRMLVKNPAKRATIPELLNHPWLSCSAKVSKGVAAVPDAVVARLNQFAAMNHFKKEARKVLASLLPEEEVMGLLNIFKEMDTDGNGVISLPELVSGLEKKGVKLPQEQAALMIKCADINSDGVVDYEEFLAGTVHQSRLEKDELMFKAFRKFDRDGCGFIKPQDLRDALSGHKTQVDVDSILQEIDADHDGRINYEEFCNCLRNKENSKNSYGSSLKKYTMKSAALSLLSNPKNSSQATQGHSELAVKHVAPSCLSESAISDMHASDHVFRQIFGSNLEVTKKKLKAAAA